MNHLKKDKKTILFTGATGYLGSNILKALVDSGDYEVIILKRSFSDVFRIKDLMNKIISYDINNVDINKIFAENKIDIILHCATDYGRKNADPMQIVEANLLLPIKLLDAGSKHKVKIFINTDTILDKRINHYSLSKKQFRDWLDTYKDQLTCINITLEHFYGPGDDQTKFVSYIFSCLLNQVDKIDLTKGEQKRDFIYIDDVTDAFMRIINYSRDLGSGFYEYQIGSNQSITIKEFVVLMKNILDNEKTLLNFGALPYRENEIMECVADISEIMKLGWTPKYSPRSGLENMINQELTNKKAL